MSTKPKRGASNSDVERSSPQEVGPQARPANRVLKPSPPGVQTIAFKDLPTQVRNYALDMFAAEYRTRLAALDRHYDGESDNHKSEAWKQGSLETITKMVADRFAIHVPAPARNFDMWVMAAYEQGLIRIVPRIDAEKSQSLTDKIGVNMTVVAGDLSTRFSEVAGAVMVEEMIRIAVQREARKQPGQQAEVCIGIVSGITCRATIKYVCSCNWRKDLGVDIKDHAVKFKIFPLNVTLVGPNSLGGNATILGYELAEKINGEGGEAEAYGLNADLIVPKSQLREVDMRFVQTRNVLEYTEPHRVKEGVTAEVTKLDLVLTGVGQRPDPNDPSGGSLFYQLMKDNEFQTREPIAGDLAFCPLYPDGEPASIVDPKGCEFMFYSAISLKTLEAMAADRTNKSVILVAQSKEQQDKIRAILGSTRALNHEKRPYVSRVVIDETMAKGLSAFL